MAKKPVDPGTVTQSILAALESLSPEYRGRVMDAVMAFYSIGGPSRETGVAHRPTQTSNEPPVVPAGQRPVSLVELIQDKRPATNGQRLALFAYYRERVEGNSRFARGDLLHYFAVAKEAKPGNYDRDFSKAVKEGWIHEDGSESYLTSRGLEAVETGFGGKAKARGVSAAKTAKRKAK